MECRDIERLIDAWLDGGLARDEAAAFASHMADCVACRRRWGPVLDLLRSPADVSPPAGLREKILAGVDQLAASMPRGVPGSRRVGQTAGAAGRWLWWGGAAAASLALFFTGWFGSRWAGPPKHVEKPDAPSAAQAVVLSPWMLSSMAQAMTLHGPPHSFAFAAQGIAVELLVPLYSAAEPEPSPRRSAASRDAAEPDGAFPLHDIPVLPPVLRL